MHYRLENLEAYNVKLIFVHPDMELTVAIL